MRRQPRSWSLRRRLLIWLLTPMLLLCTAMLIEAYLSARNTADKAYDRLLHASALAIAERVVVIDGEIDVDLPYVALEMLASTTHDRVFYKVTGAQGMFVTGYRDLPPVPDQNGLQWDSPTFYDAVYRGNEVRIVALSRRTFENGFTVQVAHTRGERELLMQELTIGTARRLLLLVAVAALIFWFGINRGLAPLALLEREIRHRSPEDLQPLESDVPREVRHLVTAINQLIERLSASLVRMQRFTSDAAHQLRTPLAALQTQAELALRENDATALRDSAARLHAATRRTSRLAHQLLSHARASADDGSINRTRLDLAQLAAEVTRDNVPRAIKRRIDLGFESPNAIPPILGDTLLLRELLKNLIDNALHYCPQGSHVTVRVLPGEASQTVHLEVEDDGPGIPLAEREHVFERFYRVPGGDTEGSGLGLAIVHEITKAHGGRVTLHTGSGGNGLLVCVTLPAARALRGTTVFTGATTGAAHPVSRPDAPTEDSQESYWR